MVFCFYILSNTEGGGSRRDLPKHDDAHHHGRKSWSETSRSEMLVYESKQEGRGQNIPLYWRQTVSADFSIS